MSERKQSKTKFQFKYKANANKEMQMFSIFKINFVCNLKSKKQQIAAVFFLTDKINQKEKIIKT